MMKHHDHDHHHVHGAHGHDARGRRGRGEGWGEGPWGGPRGGGRRRMRRGDIRRAVLSALAEGPTNGYGVITRLEERSAGMWRPSPGSVYPTLQLLEDEGLVTGDTRDGSRTYELTDAGREAQAAAGQEGPEGAPWAGGEQVVGAHHALRDAARQTMGALRQVFQSGSPEQIEQAAAVLQRARKELYSILAGD